MIFFKSSILIMKFRKYNTKYKKKPKPINIACPYSNNETENAIIIIVIKSIDQVKLNNMFLREAR